MDGWTDGGKGILYICGTDMHNLDAIKAFAYGYIDFSKLNTKSKKTYNLQNIPTNPTHFNCPPPPSLLFPPTLTLVC